MAQEYHLILNSNEMCRNCLARNCSNLKSLFRCDIIDGEIWSIPKVYKNITNITITEHDGFPHSICTQCETSMFEAFIFKQKSIKSHKLLQRIMKTKIKHEEDDLFPLQVERRSQMTQTYDNDEIVEANIKEDKSNHSSFDYIGESEEAEESNDLWEIVYLNEESLVEQNNLKSSKSLEEIEIENQFESFVDITEMFECEFCSEQISQPLLQTHMNQHSKIIPYLLSSMDFFRCNRCLMVFPYIDLLLEHVSAEDLCERSTELNKDTDYQYTSNEFEIRLFSTCKNIDNSTFSCSLCTLDFEDLFGFRAHFKEKHLLSSGCIPDYIRTDLAHVCGICENKFQNLQDCLHHVYFHQETYACAVNNCNHVTASFTPLYFHFTRGHSQTLNCKYCLYQANTKDDLKEHLRTSCTARHMKCDICGKLFHKKSTLNMHMRTHTNDRKYTCSICPKAFLQNNDLTNHMRIHTGEKPYNCELCDRSFKTVGQRSGHLATHTTKNNFKCDICHKTFKSARILHGHKKIHGERKFECEECGKKFNRKYHLTLHMKRHEQTTKKQK